MLTLADFPYFIPEFDIQYENAEVEKAFGPECIFEGHPDIRVIRDVEPKRETNEIGRWFMCFGNEYEQKFYFRTAEDAIMFRLMFSLPQ